MKNTGKIKRIIDRNEKILDELWNKKALIQFAKIGANEIVESCDEIENTEAAHETITYWILDALMGSLKEELRKEK